MSEPLLTVENLKTQFFTEEGTVRAVDGVNFEVNEGELVGLVGESGAGKSVAAQSIMRLVEEPGRIVDGTVTFDGKKLVDITETPDGRMEESDEMLSNREMREQIRGREIAIVFQDPMESLNPVFKVGAQLREFIELNREVGESEAKRIAVDMLREVGIPEPEARYDDYPHEFSGGMRQRVLIAMALACEPRLIIADEPTTALDVTVEGQILDLVSDLQERYDTAFLWVTHDMGVVAEICDRVNVMYLGEVVEEAKVDDLFHDTKHPYTEALLRSMPRPDQAVESLDPIKGVMPEAINPPSGCRFHTRCPEAREACKEFHPEYHDVSDASEAPHSVSCIKYEAVGYEDSDPLETEATGAFAGGLAEMRGDEGGGATGVSGGGADE
ncbi:ABC transporter ATP-binding protein [Halobaculum halobium]|uniref:Nickel import system ATP-binding protein NikD n=1 Tax=Halobaculum halobium TaxID=3032281 RepID=A0ABD5TG30_9EURY|nr:ABC transporter ATP-binding protein [Halobaculum sp. SYNS20]